MDRQIDANIGGYKNMDRLIESSDKAGQNATGETLD